MLDKISFADKNKKALSIADKILTDQNINEIKYVINDIVDYVNQFNIPVSSVNGQTGDVQLNFPVSSVNGQTGNVQINFPVSSVNGLTGHVNINIPVSSVNGKTGNVNLKVSDLPNDMGYITADNIPVISVNGKTGVINLTTNDLTNDAGYITSKDILVKSVNGQTGDVNINFPVLSVNGLTGDVNIDFPVSSVNSYTGHVTLKMSDLDNDMGYITRDSIPVSSVSTTNTPLSNPSSTGNVKIFVPNKTSQVENDTGYYNNLQDFIRIISSVDELANAESGYLYCILQEED